MHTLLAALAADLRDRGGLDLSRCFVRGRFVFPPPPLSGRASPDAAEPPGSWQFYTALILLRPLVSALSRRLK
jgi:hypothetical protein